ncbi:MAG: J domain-containing protein [Cyanobacteriota bacterium]
MTSQRRASSENHYDTLGLAPGVSEIQIRRAYRKLSKRYHPDTTQLEPGSATVRFQEINEAYRILSNPERRALYDLQIGYSRWNVVQAPPDENPQNRAGARLAYLDPTDRPLSAGEIFALLLLGLTLLGCLALALLVAWLRGEG